MITETIAGVLRQEGPATFVTVGADGPHLVATWQSYLRILDADTMAFPAGGFNVTEANVRAGSKVQMIIGARQPKGVGFRLTGTAEFQVDTPIHAQLKKDFPWCRAAVLLHVTGVEKVLG